MNRKEPATREKILNAARSEFLAKGYKGACLRDIAKNAGVTTGALYGYFRNKGEVFGALVEEAYFGIQMRYRDILRNFSKLPLEQQQAQMEDAAIRGCRELADYMYDHYDAFKLILCCSEDTEYSDLVEEMARLDEKATDDFTETTRSAGQSIQRINANLEHMLTKGLFTMFFELVIHDIPKQEVDEYVTHLIHFFTAGCARVMGF